jgi:hypothetical protein
MSMTVYPDKACQPSLVSDALHRTIAYEQDEMDCRESGRACWSGTEAMNPEPLPGYIWLDTRGRRTHVWAAHLELRD